jgi:hypothetical protein
MLPLRRKARADAAKPTFHLAREGRRVAHEVAKLMLEHAGTFVERTEAIKVALSLGMPLNEIEEYLDWLDSIRSDDRKKKPDDPDRGKSQ